MPLVYRPFCYTPSSLYLGLKFKPYCLRFYGALISSRNVDLLLRLFQDEKAARLFIKTLPPDQYNSIYSLYASIYTLEAEFYYALCKSLVQHAGMPFAFSCLHTHGICDFRLHADHPRSPVNKENRYSVYLISI